MTPENIATQLFNINLQLEQDDSNLTTDPTQAAAIAQDLNTQWSAIWSLMQTCESQMSSLGPGPMQNAYKNLYLSLCTVHTDLASALGDLNQTTPNTTAASEVLEQGAIIDTATSFRLSVKAAGVQVDMDRQAWDLKPTAANATALTQDLTNLSTFLVSGIPAPNNDPWNALGISQTQYTNLQSAITSTLADIVSNPTRAQIEKLDKDWAAAFSITNGLNPTNIESEDLKK